MALPGNRSGAAEMMAFIDASPSPFHACAEVAARLERAGFVCLEEAQAWSAQTGCFYVARAGSLVAWAAPEGRRAQSGFRVIGAHTDSPNLRIKPHADTGQAGCRQLAVEVYGGVLLNSWLDRDLGLSGRVTLRGPNGPQMRLVKIDRPLMRVSQLAIHLDREVNEKGLRLDRQLHLAPLWSLGEIERNGLASFLAAELQAEAGDILAFDLMCHDTQPASLLGRECELVASARLDNLCSSWCGLEALLHSSNEGAPERTSVLCLFDHEEVGSTSQRGAAGPLLPTVLERIVLQAGGTRDDYHRAMADSFCASVDMAHATHPNYTERHEPEHWIALNAGPVIKINTSMRYATDSEGEGLFQVACESAGVPFQKYVNRSNLACGSTIGPITAARAGLRTFDVGNPQLSMHSIRELCGAADPDYMVRALTGFLSQPTA